MGPGNEAKSLELYHRTPVRAEAEAHARETSRSILVAFLKGFAHPNTTKPLPSHEVSPWSVTPLHKYI